jgi:hypothetical protein
MIRNDTILIRKLSAKTRVGDCGHDLHDWLNLSEEDVNALSSEWKRYPMIGDVPHDVWMCTIKQERYFGKTLREVATNAGITL